MNGGFERFALVFLSGAVVIALSVALFRGVPDGGTSDTAPAPPRAVAPQVGAPQPDAPAQEKGGVPRARIDAAPAPWLGEYDLDAVAAGETVPRGAAVESVGDEREARGARGWFVSRALPLALLVNEAILMERARLWGMRQKLRAGEGLTAEDRLWLAATADRYHVSEDNLVELSRRLDAVPPSIILAVVGSKRRWIVSAGGQEEGNAREHSTSAGSQGGASAIIDATLGAAIRSEVHALNTAPQFVAFREARERLRHDGTPLVGAVLTRALPSGHSPAWPGSENLRSVISGERLERFDRARLEPAPGPA